MAISKLSWIKKQQAKILKQERETPREFLNLENHYYKGERYLLNIIKESSSPKVILRVKTHNDTFVAYLDKSLPNWRLIKEELNRLPLKHEDWKE